MGRFWKSGRPGVLEVFAGHAGVDACAELEVLAVVDVRRGAHFDITQPAVVETLVAWLLGQGAGAALHLVVSGSRASWFVGRHRYLWAGLAAAATCRPKSSRLRCG